MAALVWKMIAALAMVLAAMASVLPVLPTAPFLLLAAMAAGRGWPWLERRLLANAAIGPVLVGWRSRGVLPRSVKWACLTGLAMSGTTVWFWPGPPWIAIGTDAALLAVGIWLYRRPTA